MGVTFEQRNYKNQDERTAIPPRTQRTTGPLGRKYPTASCDVKNTDKVAGTEVVQVYVRDGRVGHYAEDGAESVRARAPRARGEADRAHGNQRGGAAQDYEPRVKVGGGAGAVQSVGRQSIR